MAEQWEYTRVYVDFEKDDLGHSHTDGDWAKIDALGLDGWEAVGITANVGTTTYGGGMLPMKSLTVTHGLYVLLKRPKQS